MSYIVWKAFMNFEKEEQWLNDMSKKGFALKSMVWCRYEFEPSKPGEYIYRLEMMKSPVRSPENTQYLQFLKDTGIELVTSYMQWTYFRKKAVDGPFEVYTDLESKIAHYKTVRSFWLGMSVIELTAAVSNLTVAITYATIKNEWLAFRWITGILFLGLGLWFFLFLQRPLTRRIQELVQERSIHE